MTKGKNIFSRILHAKPEDIIRRIRAFISFDKPSNLALSSFGEFDIAYRKNTVDELIFRDSFNNDIFFSGVPEYKPKSGDVIIEIGAHIGTFSVLASSKIGNGKIFAIEASADTFNFLKINRALNHCENISIHHLAISDRNGKCTLYHYKGNWGHSLVKKLSGQSEEVKCSTLSDFFRNNQISRCNFMKFNCEGSEFPIILSTPGEMLQRIEIILVLYHCDLWNKNTESDLVLYLNTHGFECEIRNKSKKRGWIIATQKFEK